LAADGNFRVLKNGMAAEPVPNNCLIEFLRVSLHGRGGNFVAKVLGINIKQDAPKGRDHFCGELDALNRTYGTAVEELSSVIKAFLFSRFCLWRGVRNTPRRRQGLRTALGISRSLFFLGWPGRMTHDVPLGGLLARYTAVWEIVLARMPGAFGPFFSD
jgi:hypothetical protein